MIKALKPHANYKPVPSSWVHRVPEHWDVRKLRTLIKPRNERNNPTLPLLSVAREKGVFIRSSGDDNHNVIPEDLASYKVARKGCLVVNKMKAWQGSMGVAPCDGIVSPAYFVYDLAVSNRLFGQALLRSRPYVAHFAQASDGVRIGQWDLSIDGMREIPVVLPPPDEQTAIIRFLDHANRRIEQFIRAKRKLIALLNEQKQLIVLDTIRRGLDRDVLTKESNVPWLGRIPAHWDVLRAKALIREVDERSLAGKEELLSVSHITGVTPRSEKNITMFKAQSYAGYKLCQPGDLVVNTMWAWMGALGVSRHAGIVSSAYAVYRPKVQLPLLGEYLEMLLHTQPYLSNFMSRSTGMRASRLRLYPDQFLSIPVVVPPLSEQWQIVGAIAKATSGIVIGVRRAEAEVALLREYRARLVADVVTGQLDVREAARAIPAVDGSDEASDGEGPAEVDETDHEAESA